MAKGICQPLNAQSNWTVLHVRGACLLHRVIIVVNDSIEIACDNFSASNKVSVIGKLMMHAIRCASIRDLKQLGVIEDTIFDKSWQSQRCEIAHSDLIRRSVFDDFGAQVGTADGA